MRCSRDKWWSGWLARVFKEQNRLIGVFQDPGRYIFNYLFLRNSCFETGRARLKWIWFLFFPWLILSMKVLIKIWKRWLKIGNSLNCWDIYIYVQKGHVCMSFDGLKRIVTVRPNSILQSKCMYVRMFCLQSIKYLKYALTRSTEGLKCYQATTRNSQSFEEIKMHW